MFPNWECDSVRESDCECECECVCEAECDGCNSQVGLPFIHCPNIILVQIRSDTFAKLYPIVPSWATWSTTGEKLIYWHPIYYGSIRRSYRCQTSFGQVTFLASVSQCVIGFGRRIADANACIQVHRRFSSCMTLGQASGQLTQRWHKNTPENSWQLIQTMFNWNDTPWHHTLAYHLFVFALYKRIKLHSTMLVL